MATVRHFALIGAGERQRCAQWVLREAPDGWAVYGRPPVMGETQRQRFNALCADIARAGITFAGKRRSAAEWRVLLISGHNVATGGEAELVSGLEGELIDLRESTTSMSMQRGASLITYTTATAVNFGVALREPEARG